MRSLLLLRQAELIPVIAVRRTRLDIGMPGERGGHPGRFALRSSSLHPILGLNPPRVESAIAALPLRPISAKMSSLREHATRLISPHTLFGPLNLLATFQSSLPSPPHASTAIICAVALIVLTIHLAPYVHPRALAHQIQTLGRVGSLLGVTTQMSFVTFTDNPVRPFSPQFKKSSLFYLTRAPSFCRDLRAHRSELRVNPRPGRLQRHLHAWNRRLERHLYDATVSTRPNLFNSRNRAQHARKCKIVSRIFSLKSVHEYEPYVRPPAKALLRQWDKLARAERMPRVHLPRIRYH